MDDLDEMIIFSIPFYIYLKCDDKLLGVERNNPLNDRAKYFKLRSFTFEIR